MSGCGICGVPDTGPTPPATAEDSVRASGTNRGSECYVRASIRDERISYCKRSEGDCGTQTKVSLGSPQRTVGQIGGAAIETIGSLQFTSLGSTGFVSGIAPFLGPASLAIMPFAVWGLFKAHHKAAVAREQATLCAVSDYYNESLGAIKDALRKGQIDLAGAQAALDQVTHSAIGGLEQIKKSCNFACGMTFAIMGLTHYEKNRVFPMLAKGQAPRKTVTVIAAAAIGVAAAKGFGFI